MTGREYCRTHGGTKPIGPMNHAWKHGRRSKYIPARFAEKYAESLEDPHLTEFRQDIALLESRLYEVLQTGESQPLWDAAQDAFRDLRKAMASGDRLDVANALSTLESLINRGMADAIRWAEVYRVTEQIGKTKEREHKRMVAAQQMISVEQFFAIVGQIADAAKRTITDKSELKAFAAALNQYGVVEVSRDDRTEH